MVAVDNQPWQRLANETTVAFEAFSLYLNLPPKERSIDAAWRIATSEQQKSNKKRANGRWTAWSAQHSWPARAAAHDAHLAAIEQDEYDQTWLQRRRESRESDWTQAQAMRKLVDDSLPHAERFIKSQRTIVPAQGDTPEREVITLSFNIVALSRVLMDASKLQRLATNQTTENVASTLTDEQADAMIEAALADILASRAARKEITG